MSLPYDYFPAVLYAIERIAEGNSPTTACDLANINIPLFEKYVEGNSELQDLLREAVRRGHDALADSLLDIPKHTERFTTDPKVMKIVSENIKWVLSKRDSKKFGEKVVVDVNVTADKAIVEALQAGRRRVSQITNTPIVDLTPTEVVEEIPDFLRV